MTKQGMGWSPYKVGVSPALRIHVRLHRRRSPSPLSKGSGSSIPIGGNVLRWSEEVRCGSEAGGLGGEGGSGAGKLQAGIPAIRQMGSDHEGFLFQAKEFGPLSLMKETLPRILNWKATCLHQILFVCSATVFAVCPHCWRLTAMDSIGPSVSSLGLLWESVTNQVGYLFPVLEARSLESRCRQGWFPLEFLRENLFMPLP